MSAPVSFPRRRACHAASSRPAWPRQSDVYSDWEGGEKRGKGKADCMGFPMGLVGHSGQGDRPPSGMGLNILVDGSWAGLCLLFIAYVCWWRGNRALGPPGPRKAHESGRSGRAVVVRRVRADHRAQVPGPGGRFSWCVGVGWCGCAACSLAEQPTGEPNCRGLRQVPLSRATSALQGKVPAAARSAEEASKKGEAEEAVSQSHQQSGHTDEDRRRQVDVNHSRISRIIHCKPTLYSCDMLLPRPRWTGQARTRGLSHRHGDWRGG